MELKKGTEVYTADGKRVGRVDRVVLDPRTDQVTHIVVEKGFLFVTDKVVPIQLVETATEERVTLKKDAKELGSLANFIDVEYVQADWPNPGQRNQSPESYPAPMYWNPPIGSIWGGAGGYRGNSRMYAYPSPPYITRETKNIPEQAVALEEGAKVLAKGGEHVGNVEEIVTDADSEQVTHLVISRGFLGTERKLIPVTWLDVVEEGQIHLAVTSQVVEGLDKYEAQGRQIGEK